jgi:hypothetical protein
MKSQNFYKYDAIFRLECLGCHLEIIPDHTSNLIKLMKRHLGTKTELKIEHKLTKKIKLFSPSLLFLRTLLLTPQLR